MTLLSMFAPVAHNYLNLCIALSCTSTHVIVHQSIQVFVSLFVHLFISVFFFCLVFVGGVSEVI